MSDRPITPQLMLKQFVDGPENLEDILKGLSEDDLNLALTAESWLIRQIVHHIADGDDLWKTCVKAIIGNNDGLFSLQWNWDKPQTEWVEKWHYSSRQIEPSQWCLRLNRQHITVLLQQTPEAWEQSIRIKWSNTDEEELVTLGSVIEMQVQHLIGNIRDIHSIRQKYNLENEVN